MIISRMMREPWCWTAAEVGRHTMFQLLELILFPAMDEQKKMRSDVQNQAPQQPDNGPGRLDRDGWIAFHLDRYGKTPEHWGQMYDEIAQAASA